MKTRATLLIAAILASLNSGCDSHIAPNGSQQQASQPATTPAPQKLTATDEALRKASQPATTPAPRVLTATDEALQEAQSRVDSVWQKLGDSSFSIYYFAIGESELVEAKNLSLTAYSKGPLSEADKLNGLEWSGSVELTAKASRNKTRISGDKWSQWQNGMASGGGFHLEKRNGQWKVENYGTKYERSPAPEQIPK